MNRPYHVGVIGSGACSPGHYALAERVGFEIGKRRWTLICGGLGGVMEGAAKGCAEAGGMTVGLLPGLHRERANAFIRIAVPTGLGDGRNLMIVRASDILVAISGGYGTLSEIALALKNGKKVIGLQSFEDVEGMLSAADPEGVIDRLETCLTP
ncbi:MAG: TIGR00725 family protein [Desulfatiglandaceae bacterium]|jgi:uncharacterized protein (TIGR00725 family)